MIERYYTFTVSHCSKAIKYGLYWLLNGLMNKNLEKGCILAVGKSNFCSKTIKVYREALGNRIVQKVCRDGYVNIKGKKIDFQYPRKMSIYNFDSILAIYPNKKVIQKIEESFESDYHDKIQRSVLIIPWAEFHLDKWIDEYKPEEIRIDCAEGYVFGSCRRFKL